MEIEDLKSEYQSSNANKSMDNLKKMGSTNRHPVLKRIRLQLIIESILWAILLAVYYSGFDGNQKPLYWNVILVVSIILLLIHNVLGYRLVQSPINGSNLAASLRFYLQRIRRYAIISIATRAIAVMALILFLTANVDWTSTKVFRTVIFVVVLVTLQIFFLWKIWRSRIDVIKGQVDSLDGNSE